MYAQPLWIDFEDPRLPFPPPRLAESWGMDRPQKITFAEVRARLPRDESKKPPDLRREVFV
jgi:hypothetical protein